MQHRTTRDGGRRVLLGGVLLALSLSGQVLADGDSSALKDFRFSGFATLGMSHHDNHDVGVISSFAQFRPAYRGWSERLDSALGLQLEWQALPHTSLLVQGVARSGQDLRGEVRMAYLRQQLGQDLAVRLGRIRSPLFFDSDVNEIGYAYLQVRQPLPLYSVASNVSHIDGADLQLRKVIGNTALLMQMYYGSSSYTHYFYNYDNQPADAKLNDIRGLAVSAAMPNLLLRASRTWVNSYTLRSPLIGQMNAGLEQLAGGVMAMSANPMLGPAGAALATQAGAIAGQVNPYDNKPIYTSVGFDAFLDNWRVLGEWATFDSQSQMVGKYGGHQLTLAYSLGEFTPYVSHSRWNRKSSAYVASGLQPTGFDPMGLDPALAGMGEALGMAATYSDISTRSLSLGVRWDFRENMALKFQYDRLRTPGSMTPGFLAVRQLPIDHRVNLFTAALDFVF